MYTYKKPKRKSSKKSTSPKKTSSSTWKKVSSVDGDAYLFFKGSSHFGQIALKAQTTGDAYSLHPAVVNGKMVFAKKMKNSNSYIIEKFGIKVVNGKSSGKLKTY